MASSVGMNSISFTASPAVSVASYAADRVREMERIPLWAAGPASAAAASEPSTRRSPSELGTREHSARLACGSRVPPRSLGALGASREVQADARSRNDFTGPIAHLGTCVAVPEYDAHAIRVDFKIYFCGSSHLTLALCFKFLHHSCDRCRQSSYRTQPLEYGMAALDQ